MGAERQAPPAGSEHRTGFWGVIQWLVNLSTARMNVRHSSSSAALNIRMRCVFGSTNRQIRAQSAAMNIIRKAISVVFSNIAII